MTLRAWEERTTPASVGTMPRAWRRISGCPTSCSRRRNCCEIADGVYVRASAAAVTDPSSTTASSTCRRLTSSMPEHLRPQRPALDRMVEALLQGTVAIRDGTSLRRGPLWVPAGHTQSSLRSGRHSMRLKKALKLLYVQVLIGLVLGITVGQLFPDFGASLKVLGDLFVNVVKMMIAPIVFCTIVTGITSVTDSRKIGRTLGKSLGLFYVLTFLALTIGLVTVLLMKPGVGMHIDPSSLDASVAADAVKEAPPGNFGEFLLHIVPTTFVGAFSDGHVLPVLLLSVLCGFGLSKIGRVGQPLLTVITSFSHLLFAVFGYLMRLAPVGAFGAMAFTVGEYGIGSIGSLGWLIGTFYTACVVFVVVVLGTLARLHNLSLWRLLRYFREELLVVLGTSSSEPVLPRLLMKLERLGCKRGVVGLVLPTGYSFNLDGTAIYLTLASLFIAQACDITLSFGQIIAMLGLMLLTSKGAAGVTGSGFVALVATLAVFPTLPVAGVALIVGIDRFMSEARALTSTMSNIVVSVVVAKWEKAVDKDVLKAELTSGYRHTEEVLEHGGDILEDEDEAKREREGERQPVGVH